MLKLIKELKVTFVIVLLTSLVVFGGAAGVTMVRGKFILSVAIALTAISYILWAGAYMRLRKSPPPPVHDPQDK